MNVVRWGMVGCGAVTEKKSAPSYMQLEGSRLVAVASRSIRSAQAYATRTGIEQVFEDPHEMMRSPEVDAVYIATPPSSHFGLAMSVAEAGKPCCVEKPLGMSSVESSTMVRAFEVVTQPLFVAYYRRSLPRFNHVKAWINRGMLGDIRHVHWSLSRKPTAADRTGKLGWRTDTSEAPGGYFNDLACHGLNLFDFFLGPIVEAGGVSVNQQHLYPAADAVAASWSHKNGTTGSGFWNFAAFKRSDHVQIIGSDGEARLSIFDEAPLVLESKGGSEIVEVPNPDPIQIHHVENMLRHLAGEGLHPSDGRSAARTDWVMEQILAQTRHR